MATPCLCGSGRAAKRCHRDPRRRSDAARQLLAGNTWGIFVDDTDLHIDVSLHKHLRPGTTVWCALIVPSRNMEEFLYRSDALVARYCELWDVEVLHFTDVISDRGVYKDRRASLDQKIDCVREAIEIILATDGRIVQQSGYDERVAELRSEGALDDLPGGLRKSVTKEVTLAYLLHYVTEFLRAHGSPPGLMMIEEHGSRRAGTSLADARFEFFVNEACTFIAKGSPQIQFADLVAYGYSRTILSLSRNDVGEGQHAFWREFARLDLMRWSADMTLALAEATEQGGRFTIDAEPWVRRVRGTDISPEDPKFHL